MSRPRKYQSVEEMQARIDEYFRMCDSEARTYVDDKGRERIIYKPYTISGLCLYLDIDRGTLIEYGKLDAFSHTVKSAKKKIENWIEEHSLTGELQPVVSIFNLKNNFGWTDKTEVEVNAKMAIPVNESQLEAQICRLLEKHNSIDILPEAKPLLEGGGDD